jgi:hypothetical protein
MHAKIEVGERVEDLRGDGRKRGVGEEERVVGLAEREGIRGD